MNTEAKSEQEIQETGPRVRIEKAHADMERIVAWLLKADYRMKLAACLVYDLLRHEGDLRCKGYYDGDLGNDLLKDWAEEIASAAPPEAIMNDDAWIAGFARSLSIVDA